MHTQPTHSIGNHMWLPSIEKKHTNLLISKDSTYAHGEAMPLDRNSPPKRYPACSIFGGAYTHFWRTQNPLWEKQTSHAATLDGHLKSKRHIWGAMATHEKSGCGTHFEASLARTIFWKARRGAIRREFSTCTAMHIHGLESVKDFTPLSKDANTLQGGHHTAI